MPDPQAPLQPVDAELVAQARAGDRAAFGTLVERYWPMAVALARAQVRDSAAAEDIAQEGFLRAYSHLADLRRPERFAGWLGRIVVQQAVTWRRRHKGNGTLSLHRIAEPHEPAILSDDPEAFAEQQRESVRRAVEALPPRLQQVILMRFTGNLTAPQIARQLGQRPGTIRIWLHRAYARLRRAAALDVEEVNER